MSKRAIGRELGLYKGTVNKSVGLSEADPLSLDELLKLEDPVLEKRLTGGNPNGYEYTQFCFHVHYKISHSFSSSYWFSVTHIKSVFPWYISLYTNPYSALHLRQEKRPTNRTTSDLLLMKRFLYLNHVGQE